MTDYMGDVRPLIGLWCWLMYTVFCTGLIIRFCVVIRRKLFPLSGRDSFLPGTEWMAQVRDWLSEAFGIRRVPLVTLGRNTAPPVDKLEDKIRQRILANLKSGEVPGLTAWRDGEVCMYVWPREEDGSESNLKVLLHEFSHVMVSEQGFQEDKVHGEKFYEFFEDAIRCCGLEHLASPWLVSELNIMYSNQAEVFRCLKRFDIHPLIRRDSKYLDH